MEFQGDVGQQQSKRLPTITEITTFNERFSAVTYYVQKLRSSFISVFISIAEGVKNNVFYEQGHLVVTKDSSNQTNAFLQEGHLIINAKPEESYALDDRGHLICITTKIV